jgi:serine/threonine-protein kinase
MSLHKSTLSLAATRRINSACNSFEQAWQAGARPRIEDYLDRVAEAERNDLLRELIALEMDYRQKAGEDAHPEDYQGRFPELSIAPTMTLTQHPATGTALPTPAHDLPEIPGYELIKELGRGGMGVVYWAWQSSLNRNVALKMILAGAHAGSSELARFRTEAEAVARLQHPNIVQTYDVGWEGKCPYLALEYVDGGSLAQHLDGTPLPARLAAQLIEALARAVHYAHLKGVVHRDLTPANILLQRAEGRGQSEKQGASDDSNSAIANLQSAILKITDFGLAKMLVGAGPTLTQSGAVLGTPSYMAPEQASGQVKAVGVATDVYALGAILYELLTGRPPFKAQTPLETLLQVQTQEPVSPSRLQPKLPRDLTTICLRCLEKEPARRYLSAEALADDLRRFLAGEPIQARPIGNTERLWRWCRRNPAAAALVAMLVVALVGGAAGLIGYIEHRTEQAVELVARRARYEREVNVACQEAAKLGERAWALTEDPHSWETALAEARSVIKRAEILVGDAGDLIEPELQERVRATSMALEADEKDRQVVSRFEQIQFEQKGVNINEPRFSPEDTIPKYREAFWQYGPQVSRTPKEAAEFIRGKRAPVRSALVQALDDWLWWDSAVSKKGVSEEGDWLKNVLAAAETDSWREQVREAFAGGQRATLEQLARDEAIDRQPASSLVFLSRMLQRQKAADPAIRLLYRAQHLYPANFWVNYELAEALSNARPPKLEEAIKYRLIGVALRPQTCGVHFDLGNAYLLRKDVPRAIAEYEKAIAMDARYAPAHNYLGVALQARGDLPAAIAAHRKAIAVDPAYAGAYNALGIALKEQVDYPAAIAAYRQALALKPDYALAQYNLAQALLFDGQFAESLIALQRCREQGFQVDEELLSLAHRWVELDKTLPDVLNGKQQLTSAEKKIDYAQLCYTKRLFAASARLFEEAFAVDPALVNNYRAGHRYSAACAAAQAGASRAEDSRHVSSAQRSYWRRQALDWLRAELPLRTKLLAGGNQKDRLEVEKDLRQRWLHNPELAGVRDSTALAKLPAEEREGWQKLWSEVATALERITADNR